MENADAVTGDSTSPVADSTEDSVATSGCACQTCPWGEAVARLGSVPRLVRVYADMLFAVPTDDHVEVNLGEYIIGE